jgi:hypothetical protein
MSPKIRLRRFLYLDSALTDEFLGQVEGGLFDTESLTSKSRAEHGVGGTVGAGPVSVGAGKEGADEEASERLVRQTAESAFNRLAELLEKTDSVQWLESLDEEIWEQLSRGEVLEVECRLVVPPLIKFLLVATQLPAMTQLMDVVGGEQFDTETMQGIQSLLAIGELMQSIPVIAEPAGAPGFKFVAQIRPEHLRIGVDELETEARLYCTLDRKLGSSEQFSVIDVIPAVRNLPNREELEESMATGEAKELMGEPVTAPAAVVSAVAIYR